VRLSGVRRFICRSLAGPLVPRLVTGLSCFQVTRTDTIDRPLGSYASSFILPAPISSSEFLRLSLPLRVSRQASWPEPAAWVSVPRHDITGRVHHREAFQVLASFRPQVIATSRRFTPRSGSRACCIPKPCPGILTVQGLGTLPQPSTLVGWLYPLVVDPSRAHRCFRSAATRGGPRLRGLAPREDARCHDGVQSS
jgi:hypothetical protein